MSRNKIRVVWHDRGFEAKSPPNLLYPHGVDVDLSKGARPTCTANLSYPADRCGYYSVSCQTCGVTAIVTTAGRADDPRSVRLACGNTRRAKR